MKLITEQQYSKLLGWLNIQNERIEVLEKIFGKASKLGDFWEAILENLDVKHKLYIGKITGIRKTNIGYEVRFNGKKWVSVDECEVLDV